MTFGAIVRHRSVKLELELLGGVPVDQKAPGEEALVAKRVARATQTLLPSIHGLRPHRQASTHGVGDRAADETTDHEFVEPAEAEIEAGLEGVCRLGGDRKSKRLNSSH